MSGGFIFTMAENKKSFILYADQEGVFDMLPDDIAGKLIKHIFKYVNDKNPDCDDLLMKLAFEPIKLQLKRDLQKWDEFKIKQSNNGKMGGRPKKEANESEPLNTKPKQTQKTQAFSEKPNESQKSLNVTVNVNDTVSVNDTVTDNVTKKNKLHLFSESEFFQFEKFEGEFLGTDYEMADLKFYYEAVKNWSASGGNKKIDWIATARNFMIKDIQEKKIKLKNGSTTKTPQQEQFERLSREFNRK